MTAAEDAKPAARRGDGSQSAEQTPYTVWHAMEGESLIEGGVAVSARQQRKAFERAGVRYTEDPADGWDVLHLNFPGPKSLAALARATALGRPVVCHAHSVGENIAGTYRFSNALAPAVQRYFAWFYRRADTVIAVSEFMRDRLRANGVEGDVVVVSNGVDGEELDGYDDLDVDLTAKYDVSPPTVVNLAQVYEIKGVPEFVSVGERLPDLDFRWFGPKHRYLAPGETKRAVADAPANVRFPGFVEDKREVFGLGDVFFFPTRRDNQPLAILEAMYCGLPIVTRDIPAFEGLLEHGETCLKGSSVAEFVDHIEALVADPDLRATLGANAQAVAREHELHAVGADLRSVYDRLV
ncbi:MAG: glycosyltransferase family 4 protein [Halobacteriaceae archaeon]